MTRYYIVPIEDEERNLDTRYVGQIRSFPELIHCKDCMHHEPEDYCHLRDGLWYDTDFCSEAEERKEDEKV